jgi:cell division protein ZapA (FtsZ GTPase activity inhibitor)
MMNNTVIYTYINMYLDNMKNKSNSVDNSFCAVITGMITCTTYRKLQKSIYYRRENPGDLACERARTALYDKCE